MTGFRASDIGFGIWAAAGLLASNILAGSELTRTPTPRPKLSGGFGRPRQTPPPPAFEGGQSLADVVRAVRDAREQSPEKGAVTIDNKSLVTNPEKGRVSTSRVAPPRIFPSPSPSAAPSQGAPPVSPEDPSVPSTPEGTEAEWRETARATRQRVEDARGRVAELDAAGKKLENDFYAWDDGQYRDRVIKPAWDRTLRELEDSKRALSAAEKDLADLPEKARLAAAQPGWIRE